MDVLWTFVYYKIVDVCMTQLMYIYTIYVHYYSKLLYDNHSPGVYVLPSFKSMHGEFMHLIHVY